MGKSSQDRSGIANQRAQRQPQPRDVVAAFTVLRDSGREILSGIFRYLRRNHGWNIRMIPSEDELTRESVAAAVADGAAGFIVTVSGKPGALEEIVRSGLPCVAVGVRSDVLDDAPGRVAFVLSDNVGIGAMGARHLLSRGRFNSFGFVMRADHFTWSGERARGFSQALGERDVRVYGAEPGEDGTKDEIVRLSRFLQELPKPAAVMAACDLRAVHVLDACRLARLKVPGQVLVLGVDNEAFTCEHATPPLSSILPGHEEMGFLAAQALDRMIASGEGVRKLRTLVPANRVVVRESTAPISPSAALMRDAQEFIRDNFARGIRPDDVAEYLGVSRSLVELRFRETLGKTVRAVIEERRLDAVKTMLQETDRRLSLVADICGFPSLEHLSHLFKLRFGQSMSEYRRAARR
ncbi:MAG: substrate-binding domain-containing protein [Kiritimatiellae bacterium]|nr:substrate-binding domain-containing protein [Kiritimatiellia bacterium]